MDLFLRYPSNNIKIMLTTLNRFIHNNSNRVEYLINETRWSNRKFHFSWKQKTQNILARCSFDNLRFNGQNNVIHAQENVFYFNLNSFEQIHKMISFSTNSFFSFFCFFFCWQQQWYRYYWCCIYLASKECIHEWTRQMKRKKIKIQQHRFIIPSE